MVGAAPIDRVEVRVDHGPWQPARLLGKRRHHHWQRCHATVRVDRPGVVALGCRATDLAAHTQPEQAAWSGLGYGNNAVHDVPLHIV